MVSNFFKLSLQVLKQQHRLFNGFGKLWTNSPIKNDRFSFVLFGAGHVYHAQLQILEGETLFYK